MKDEIIKKYTKTILFTAFETMSWDEILRVVMWDIFKPRKRYSFLLYLQRGMTGRAAYQRTKWFKKRGEFITFISVQEFKDEFIKGIPKEENK